MQIYAHSSRWRLQLIAQTPTVARACARLKGRYAHREPSWIGRGLIYAAIECAFYISTGGYNADLFCKPAFTRRFADRGTVFPFPSVKTDSRKSRMRRESSIRVRCEYAVKPVDFALIHLG